MVEMHCLSLTHFLVAVEVDVVKSSPLRMYNKGKLKLTQTSAIMPSLHSTCEHQVEEGTPQMVYKSRQMRCDRWNHNLQWGIHNVV